jgi:hypothetical protein
MHFERALILGRARRADADRRRDRRADDARSQRVRLDDHRT